MTKPYFIFGLLGSISLFSGVAVAQSPPPSPSAAQKIPDTLMFTIDEYNDIQGRLSRGGDGDEDKSLGAENVSLYLSTILYYGPQDWTVWINGVPVGPQEDFKTFKVTEITPSYVELLVPLSAQGMRPVRLGPNQTFVTKSGVVVEGQQK